MKLCINNSFMFSTTRKMVTIPRGISRWSAWCAAVCWTRSQRARTADDQAGWWHEAWRAHDRTQGTSSHWYLLSHNQVSNWSWWPVSQWQNNRDMLLVYVWKCLMTRLFPHMELVAHSSIPWAHGMQNYTQRWDFKINYMDNTGAQMPFLTSNQQHQSIAGQVWPWFKQTELLLLKTQ